MVRVVQRWEVDAESVPLAVSKAQRARSNRRATAGARSGVHRGDGWVRKPADEQLLEFMSLHGVINLRQASKWFYGGNFETARSRVRKMFDAGLVERYIDTPWAGVVLFPTLDGQTVGLGGKDHPLRKQLAVPRNLEHKLTVIDHALVSRSRGLHVISERQIRMFEARPVEEVHRYLAAHGARVSSDGVEPGIVPSTLTILREIAASAGGGFEVVGERKTWLGLPVRTPVDERMAPFGSQRSGLRIPDYIEVSPDGELVAVEVEIANKADRRLSAIVDGYRDASAYLEKVGEKPNGSPEIRVRRRQFRQCRWVCSPEVLVELQGTHDFLSKEHRPGVVQRSMPDVFKASFDWSKQGDKRPVQVLHVNADDVGVQFALDQRNLEPQYRCGYREWLQWRALWRAEIAESLQPRFPFTRWIRGDGKLQACRAATRN